MFRALNLHDASSAGTRISKSTVVLLRYSGLASYDDKAGFKPASTAAVTGTRTVKRTPFLFPLWGKIEMGASEAVLRCQAL